MSQITFTTWEFWAAFAGVFLTVAGVRQILPSSAQDPNLRKGMLLVFSLGLYAIAARHLTWILVASVAVNHVLAMAIHRQSGVMRTSLTALAIVLNVAGLATFKYAYFVADLFPGISARLAWGAWRLDEWMLPLGISFYTFQAISYVVDVHRNTIEKPASFLSFATYITFFPQLVAGPIVRASHFLPQLESPKWVASRGEDSRHVQLILSGLLKKVLLGALVGAWIVDPAFDRPGDWFSWEVLLALYGYSLQVYADFSGYTDMAKGMAGLLGIHLPENFRFPYRATSPSEFWRRWHMTLSSWWKDYVYIPLGGNRQLSSVSATLTLGAVIVAAWAWGELGGWLVVAGGALLVSAAMLMSLNFSRRVATAVNVFLVMLVGGLWHGAHLNFVMWGALNGLVLAGWALLPRSPSSPPLRFLGWFVTFHTVVFSRIWFRAGSLISWDESTSAPHPERAWETALALLHQMQLPSPNWGDSVWDPTYLAGLGLMGAGYALHLAPASWRTLLQEKTTSFPMWVTWFFWCATTALAVWCSSSYHKPFIYWQF